MLMKKYIFLILCAGIIIGCTNPEQDEKIRLFWMQQVLELLPQPQRVVPAPGPVAMPVEPEETQVNETTEITETTEEETVPENISQPPAVPAVSPAQAKPQPRVRRTRSSQFMEITIEEEPAQITKKNTKISAKDRVYIQRALENAQLANQKTLRDIGQVFGPETQAQAFAIVARAEKILRTTASTSQSAEKYLDTQEKVLRQQNQMLNNLMQSNAKNLRSIRS